MKMRTIENWRWCVVVMCSNNYFTCFDFKPKKKHPGTFSWRWWNCVNALLVRIRIIKTHSRSRWWKLSLFSLVNGPAEPFKQQKELNFFHDKKKIVRELLKSCSAFLPQPIDNYLATNEILVSFFFRFLPFYITSVAHMKRAFFSAVAARARQ